MDGWWLDWADLYRPPGLGNVAIEMAQLPWGRPW